MRRVLLIVASMSALGVGCVRLGGFACDTDGECDLDGENGVCQPEGFCSYPDAACSSGQRFEDEAPGQLGGSCVDPGGETGSTDESTESTTDTGDEDPDGTESSDDGTTDGTDGMECGGPGEECCSNDMCDEDLFCAGTGCGCATELVVGERHTCVIKVDGSVWCWGANDLSQLGLPADNPPLSTVPTELPAAFGPGAAALELSAWDTGCGRREDGKMLCWGDDEFGQVDLMLMGAPALATGISWADPVASLGVGRDHACAHIEDGEIRCWGRNNASQIGNGAEPGPVDTVGFGEIKRFALGASHTCVLAEMDVVRCWGANGSGQLARDPNNLGATPDPQYVDFGAPVKDLVAGWAHNCALVEGEVQCWGRNDLGQLGDGTGMMQFMPQKIVADAIGDPILSLVGGTHHTCALTDAGELYCWGSNDEGQLMLEPDNMGDDTKTLVPVLIDEISEIRAAGGGRTHTCAIKTDGSVWCWGTNSDGQLGDGTQSFGFEPVRVELECP